MSDLSRFLDGLTLARLGGGSEAGLWISSVPCPPQAGLRFSLDGRPTASLPLGRWPGGTEPRRLLLIADGGSQAPERLHLTEPQGSCFAGSPPSAKMERFARNSSYEIDWEKHLLQLRYGERTLGIVMGLRTGNQVNWWEACRLITVHESPECRVIEMGGAIPREVLQEEDYKDMKRVGSLFHRHHWLNGRLYVRLHANGVCEVFAHHINSKFFDEGGLLPDTVPVIGFKFDVPGPEDQEWTGGLEPEETIWGGVRFDLSECARLATREQPGAIWREEEHGFTVWQPYMGAELYGGQGILDDTGDPFLFHAEDRNFPAGMARTLRFSLSLSDRSPKVVRYLSPAWWYGLCEEFQPEPLLPVSNEYDRTIDLSRQWVQKFQVRGGFEDGALPRIENVQGTFKGREGREPGWEGEISHALLLTAWRTGDVKDYEAAIRSAYYFTDICIDHAAKSVRIAGFRPPASALPMSRVQGPIAAYLETGDPYLLEAAEAVTLTSHFRNRNSWPRLAVGRDACYLRSALLLYRYFGEEYYRTIAYEGCLMVVQSQRENGSFGDQGGGAGVHQFAGYISKPWMGLLAMNPLIDYLEMFPQEESLLPTVRKFADWLMAEQWERNGINGWSYVQDMGGTREYHDVFSQTRSPLPSEPQWHQDTLARFLGYCTKRFGDPRYLNAWAESYRTSRIYWDHTASSSMQFIPWLQARLWEARLDCGKVKTDPLDFGPLTPKAAVIMAPTGNIPVSLAGSDGAGSAGASGDSLTHLA